MFLHKSLLFLAQLVVILECQVVSLQNTNSFFTPEMLIPFSAYSSLQIFRLLNWQNNDQIIQEINLQPANTFTAQHNQFSYYSQEQLSAIFLNPPPSIIPLLVQGHLQTKSQPVFVRKNVSSVIKREIRVDWRDKLTTRVKDQGGCGACWAFSAVADLQSLYISKYRKHVDFSQQQLIDCSSQYGNQGCGGGMMDNAYAYVISKGIALQSAYPFVGKKASCGYTSRLSLFKITSKRIIFSDCRALKQVLSVQPISVVISANPSFVFYRRGVLNSCGKQINHALQLVGLIQGIDGNYYMGKNSWGERWGQNGYVRIDSIKQEGNLCNVCAYPQLPLG